MYKLVKKLKNDRGFMRVVWTKKFDDKSSALLALAEKISLDFDENMKNFFSYELLKKDVD